ncbi:MAG: class I SAM-dependent methyltransferase [Gemmataceae bacterium]|nr:class I SAM-dependent methyltransferase [Gemmataceae bacterium]
MRTLFALALGLSAALLAGGRPAAADDPPKKKLDTEIPVVYVPTKPEVVKKMLELAAVKEGDTVYDLGCGDGRIVISAVKDFKAGRGLGLDYDPERLKDCEKSLDEAKLSPDQRKKLTFKQGDVLKMKPEDFKDVDVVTLYLYQQVNVRLKPVLKAGLKPGARVVSNTFSMGEDWPPEKTERVKAKNEFGETEYTVYLWTIKGENDRK